MAFGNKGGGSRTGPKYKQQITVGLGDGDFEYLSKLKRIRGGSLAEELRRCVQHCRTVDAIPPHRLFAEAAE